MPALPGKTRQKKEVAFEGDNTAREFEAMLRRQIRRGGAPAAVCAGFDPETASAYVEQALSSAAQSRYEEHLADCPLCRHHVVELFRLMPPEAAPLPVAQPEPPRSFFARWFDFSAWRWGLAAAGGLCVILLSVAVFQFTRQAANTKLQSADAKIDTFSSTKEPMARATQQAQPAAAASANTSAVTSAKPAQMQQPGQSQAGQVEAQAARSQTAMPLAAPAPSAAIISLPTSSINFKQALRNVIAGTVSDANGSMIANAQVKLIDTASQQARATTRTDASGQFGFGNIPQGNYLVQAQAPGFKTLQAPTAVQDLPRKANDQLALTLEVGAATETITLADVEARQSSVGGVIKPPPGNPPPPPPPNEIKLSADKKQDERMAELVKPGGAAGRGGGGAGASRASDQAARTAQEKSKDQMGGEKKEAAAAAPPRPAAPATESGLRNNEAEQTKGTASAGDVAVLPKPQLNTRTASVTGEKSLTLPTRKIGGKTFRFEHGAWLDADYKPEDHLPLTHLKRNSREFKQTLTKLPALKPFFKLGLVTVVWQGKVYEVQNKD